MPIWSLSLFSPSNTTIVSSSVVRKMTQLFKIDAPTHWLQTYERVCVFVLYNKFFVRLSLVVISRGGWTITKFYLTNLGNVYFVFELVNYYVSVCWPCFFIL